MWSDGTTIYVNAAICTLQYKADQAPIIFDIELPEGVSKADFDNLNN